MKGWVIWKRETERFISTTVTTPYVWSPAEKRWLEISRVGILPYIYQTREEAERDAFWLVSIGLEDAGKLEVMEEPCHWACKFPAARGLGA